MVGVYSLFTTTVYATSELSGINYPVLPFSVLPMRVQLLENVIAIAPLTPAQQPVVDQFIADMAALHPPLNFSNIGGVGIATNPTLGLTTDPELSRLYIPGFRDVIVTFPSRDALESYMTSKTYDTDFEADPVKNKKVFAAIVFNSGAPSFDYSIRMNATMTPTTSGSPVNVLARGYSDTDINSYWTSKQPTTGPPFLRPTFTAIQALPAPGFLTLQLMVDRWILNSNISTARLDPLTMVATANAVISMCVSQIPAYGPPLNLGPVGRAFGQLLAKNTTASLAAASAIEAELLSWMREVSFMPQSVNFTPFPYFGYNQNGFYGIALQILSFFLVIAYVFPVSRLIRGIVLEKEVKMREGMKMMGLGDAALFGSWFAFYAIFWAVLSLLIMLIASKTLFANSQQGNIFILFFLFGLSCTTFAYFISIFFSQSKTASGLGIVIFIASFFPVFSVADGSVAMNNKVLASLLSPTAFGLTMNAAGLLEQNGAGVTPSTQSAVINNFSFQLGCGMLVLDTLLYALLGWYADGVLPARFREFGVARPWNFPCTRGYWREVFGLPSQAAGARSVVNNAGSSAASRDSGPDPSFIEKPDASLLAKEREGRFVGISKLRKEFDTPDGVKVAVNDIDLHMYEGQIFVLLGHNGAGKTTTISMLTGLIEPTSGGMSIFGRDVSTQLSEVRHDLGVCPQHNVLWPELTVREHLQVFSEIKGVPVERRNAEIEKALADVGLTEKVDVLSANLSGGQKRKLSVCIALVGGSRVIFLDEPTSGMDPYSRRSTWQILQNAREGRVMVLTTHFMDEADILGDRICIMANGGVKCCGSSAFLKERYGVGYIMTLIKGPGANVDAVMKLVRAHVPEASISTNVGAELNLRLPMTSSPCFPSLLAEVNAQLAELKVLSYGVSIMSVEDAFLKISGGEHFGEGEAVREAAAPQWGEAAAVDVKTGLLPRPVRKVAAKSDAEALQAVRAAARAEQTGLQTFLRHTGELLVKRWNYARRDWKGLLYQIFLPALLIVAGLGLIQAGPRTVPEYQFSTAQFNTVARVDVNKPQYANVVPSFDFKASNNSNMDSLRVHDALRSGVLASNASMDALFFSAGLAATIPDTYGWLSPPAVISAGEPRLSYKRMSTALLNDATQQAYSKYGAYVWTKSGTVVPSQTPEEVGVATYTVMFNSTARHAGPVFMNLQNSALFSLLNNGTASSSITARNHPLPLTLRQQSLFAGLLVFTAAIIFVIAFSFLASSTALYIVKEKEVTAKHQQLISGVGIAAYWTSNYIFDFLVYCVTAALAIILAKAFNINEFMQADQNVQAAFLLNFLLYGLALVGSTYLLSFFFRNPSSAQNSILFINMAAILLIVASQLMSQISSVCRVEEQIRFIFRLLPTFSFGYTLVALAFLPNLPIIDATCDLTNGVTKSAADYLPYDALSFKGCGSYLVFLAWEGLAYLLLVFLIEFVQSQPSLRLRLPFGRDKDPPLVDVEEDEDVAAEARRVQEQLARGPEGVTDVVLLNAVRKVYGGSKVAVRKLSYGIPVGEVFGFLGINGAGKTSTLQILSGDVLPTSGSAQLAGLDIITQQLAVRRLLGYCPQFDAILDLMSVREHLELYARIKGVPEPEVRAVVETKLVEMDLKPFENKLAGRLSGGNKRKLGVAIALIGDPPIVFLDEPSTGMDPVARRFMWNVIARVATERKQCSIILTTHSMEEVEALCTRIGIMVGGRLRCLGTSQHLKNRFGAGYEAEVKLSPPAAEAQAAALEAVREFAEPAGADDATLTLRRDAIPNCAAKLGVPARGAQVTESGTGWALHASLSRNGQRVPAAEFAAWWAAEASCKDVVTYVAETFPGSVLAERQGSTLRFKLGAGAEALGKLFGKLEHARTHLGVASYTLGQTTLEAVFNSFAGQQQEERGVARGLTVPAGR